MRNVSKDSGYRSGLWFFLSWIVCFSATTRSSIIKYSIPANAISIGEEELAAEQLTGRLIALMGNGTNSTGRKIEDFEKANRLDLEKNDPYDLPVAVSRLNALLLAAEERKEKLESSSARLLSINRGGFFRGLLVVWVPVSFLLPTLAHHDAAYYRSGRLASIDRRTSSSSSAIHRISSTVNDVYKTSYNLSSSDYKFDPFYGPLLSRLEAYFGLLKINDIPCRWKLLCHVSMAPEDYKPISTLFRSLFERSQLHPKPEQYHPSLKRYFTYVWAEKKGRRFSTMEQCAQEYSSCSTPVDELINKKMLLFWQTLSKRFAIQIQDE